MRGLLRGGKGYKDRTTLLSQRLLEELRAYYKVYKPKVWLFEGPEGGPYSVGRIRKVFRAALEKAGVAPNLHRLPFSIRVLLEAVLRIPVTIQVVLGSATMQVANLMKLRRGAYVTEMSADDVKQNADGSWSYSPQPLRIRSREGQKLWTQHPARDIAATSSGRPNPCPLRLSPHSANVR